MKKVLIAEDDRFLASAYRVKLQKSGFEVLVVNDGQEAIEAVITFKPDLVLLDLVMPVKDGFSALEEIRKTSSPQQLPIVIASNLGQKEDVDRGYSLGATDFLVKSDMVPDDLVNKIKSILKIK
jgi:two-component system phosphate regulon response regulator PhoB/two-component system alkaline phosphatase synthesis response regulator PhoP